MKQIFKLLAITVFLNTSVFAQNSVMNFDGVNDYVDLGSTVGTGIRTIEMWFKPNVAINSNVNNFKALIARDNSTSNANEFNISFFPSFATPSSEAGSIRFTLYDNWGAINSVFSNSKSWNPNQWYHVAAVVHPTMGMMLYIDGIKQNSNNTYSTAVNSHSASTNVGSWGNTSNRYFNGAIDDLRLSDSALYTSNFTPPCSYSKASNTTIGVWNFNNTSFPNIAIDSSSNQNNGLINGAAKINEEICKVTIAANCLEFDGINDYVDLGSTVGTGLRTIEMWFNTSSTIDNTLSNFSPLIARKNVAPNQAGEFVLAFQPSFLGSSGALMFSVSSPSGIQNSIVSNANQWNSNQWYHVAVVIHPLQGLLMFIDGVRQTSTTPYIFPPNAKNDPTTIGTQGNISGRYFNGKIDDVRISNTALYLANFTPTCPDLATLPSTIAVWNFNDSSNVIITIDSSGNLNNGIIHGATSVKDTICKIPTGINLSTNIENQTLAFPNPFTNHINFKFSNPQPNPKIVRIYSIEGKLLIEESGSSDMEVTTEKLAIGMYFYQIIENGETVHSDKLIKQ